MTYEAAINALIEAIKDDYLQYTKRCNAWSSSVVDGSKDGLSELNRRMIAEFNESLSVVDGRKYTKIVQNGSVWGFVLKGADAKFKTGDILKAAGWATPARNAARGNIFGKYQINWTGPNYLR